ncbi:uncharacterized protein N7515_005766 [Penicillium bovifimosum]|uniref:Uncharacterized protein n=1 Tax=Penicillium bovifimosum TaxID=126998 RepID=A0A9W9GTL1_9EURO|nr:uncharacterized protein N7515_005766 [Penicillium bovifimosum]KAJ5129727.1 hypothetical protein N7515_005766 [Penicillium bovifimosum]
MARRKPRKPNASIDKSVGLLNSINASKSNAANTKNLKRRPATGADIYDIPRSPSPPHSQVPQTEPRKAGRFALRSRGVPSSGLPDPSHNAPNDEEGQKPNDDESGSEDRDEEGQKRDGKSRLEDSVSESDDTEHEPDREASYDSSDEEMGEGLEKLESEAEEDLFAIPIDLFPEDQGQPEKEMRATTENRHRDERRGRSEDRARRQAEEQAGHEPSNTSDGGDPFEDEEPVDDDSGAESRNSPAPPQQTARSSNIEVQIIQHIAREQRHRSHVSRASSDAQAFPSASSQIHEVPESTIQSPRQNQEIQEVPESPTMQSPRQNQDRRVRSDLFSWLTDATRDSVFKDDWEEIRIGRKIMKNHQDSRMKERFRDIIKLIARLRFVFETITLDSASASTLRPQYRLIANSIFKEVQWIISSEAPEDEEGAYLVNQLEAHIVPRLIDLIIHGFKAYKTIKDQASRHFSIILDLLWGCCDRISSLATIDYDISMDVRALSKTIMTHVKAIKDALHDGRLREKSKRVPRRPPRYQQFVLKGVESHISCRSWTYAERDALRNGLEFHEGEDRYVDIKCDEAFGPRLSDRILKDIRAQAIRLGLDDP